jgi:hypothetical protein
LGDGVIVEGVPDLGTAGGPGVEDDDVEGVFCAQYPVERRDGPADGAVDAADVAGPAKGA